MNKTLGSKLTGSFQNNRQFQFDGYMGNGDLNLDRAAKELHVSFVFLIYDKI